jgi:hypothetical protein
MGERAFSLTACIPPVAPAQLSLDGFEERLNHGIVATIAFSAHPLPQQCMFTYMTGDFGLQGSLTVNGLSRFGYT